MTEGIEPVPRDYRGTEFRSSLEANWAATLDSLSIEWEYEPKTFTLPSGEGYLPDFYLPKVGTWIEVKGTGIPRVEKARALAEMLACHCPPGACSCTWYGGQIVLIGHPSLRTEYKRFGTVSWSDAVGGNALLGRCTSCDHNSWVRPRISLACRHCHRRETSGCDFEHLANSGEIEFRRATGDGGGGEWLEGFEL